MGESGRWNPERVNEVRRACLSTYVSRFVRTIDLELARHRDKGLAIEAEAALVFKRVVIRLAEEIMGDSAVFLVDTPVEPYNPKDKEWEVGHHSPERGYDLTALRKDLEKVTPDPDMESETETESSDEDSLET